MTSANILPYFSVPTFSNVTILFNILFSTAILDKKAHFFSFSVLPRISGQSIPLILTENLYNLLSL